MSEQRRRGQKNRLLVNDEQGVELLPLDDSSSQVLQERLSEIIAPIGEIVGAVIAENMSAKIEITKLELPLKQETLKLQAQQIENAHEAQMHLRNFLSEKHKKDFWFSSIAVTIVLLFMMCVGGFLIYTGDKTNGMAIIGLLIGLIGGFLGGAGWQKTKNQPEGKQPQS